MDSAYGTRGWLLAGLVASMYLTGCSDDPAEPAEPGSEAGNEAGNRAQSGESGESGVSGAGGRRTGSAGGGGGRTSESAADGGGVGGPGAPGRPDAGADAGEAGTGATAGANGAAGALGPGAGSAAEGGAGGLGGAPAEAGSGGPAAPELTPEPADEAAFVFDPSALRTYDIQVAPADLALINQNPRTEMKVPAMVEVDGQVYGPYAVRYKGSEGAFMYPCTQGAPGGPKYGKCSLKLDFNDADPEGRFFGLKQLNFHALNADTSMLRERLGYQLFRDNGIAAPRSGYARVLINGELEGLFALVEQIDGRFTRARFGDGGEGNLYKEIWPAYDDPAVYSAALETNEDQQPSVQRMVDFKTAITTSADAAESFVDRDYFLRYLAVDRVTINDDGIFRFWCNAGVSQGNNPGPFGNHNYYWYEEITRPRLWLIPWDLD
ncbi:MAG: CotH kinase family protein, partial [Polyangiales bacterium]